MMDGEYWMSQCEDKAKRIEELTRKLSATEEVLRQTTKDGDVITAELVEAKAKLARYDEIADEYLTERPRTALEIEYYEKDLTVLRDGNSPSARPIREVTGQ